MAKVTCARPNAAENINGVNFSRLEDGRMLSEEISDEKAAAFIEIPGYELYVEASKEPVTTAPAPAPAPTPAPAPAEAPTPAPAPAEAPAPAPAPAASGKGGKGDKKGPAPKADSKSDDDSGETVF